MSQVQQGQVPDRLGVAEFGSFVPVDVKQLQEFLLKPAEAMKNIKTKEPATLDINELQFVEEVVATLRRILLSKGHLVVSIMSRESFIADVKRKIGLIYMLVEEVVDAATSDLERAIDEYIDAVNSGDEDRAREALARAHKDFMKITLAPVIALKLIDDMMGLMQLNLPIDIMPNTLKAHLGFVTT